MEYRKWMYRSFVWLFAVMLRLLMSVIGSSAFYICFEMVYVVNARLGWGFNLDIPWILIRSEIVNRYSGRIWLKCRMYWFFHFSFSMGIKNYLWYLDWQIKNKHYNIEESLRIVPAVKEKSRYGSRYSEVQLNLK